VAFLCSRIELRECNAFLQNFVLGLALQQAMILGVTFQPPVFVYMAFQQAKMRELTFSRSGLQGWFATGHDYKCRIWVRYDFRAGHDCRAGFKSYVYGYDLSENHVNKAALVAIYS